MNNHITIEVDDKFIYNLYKASSTLWYFDILIENGFKGYNSIKFKDKNDVFVWLENIEIEGNSYKGVLAETGRCEVIARSEAIDWLLIDNQRMLGGYTIRHYYDMLSADERINFEIYCGYRIDQGNDFFRSDCTTPEGAIINLENFYNEKDMEGILSCKDFHLEAENVMQEHKMDWDSKTHSTVVSVLRVSLLEEMEINGFPNFENIERVFNLLERRNDQELIEEKLYYPDGFVSVNKFWVGLTKDNGWKVLNRVE